MNLHRPIPAFKKFNNSKLGRLVRVGSFPDRGVLGLPWPIVLFGVPPFGLVFLLPGHVWKIVGIFVCMAWFWTVALFVISAINQK